ncbi:MAG: outer membrane protein transport protein [Bermanella sp.]
MKNSMMRMSTLAAAILAASPVMAGGFDKSDHSFGILFGDDNVITTSFSQTSVQAHGTATQLRNNNPLATTTSVSTGEIVSDINSPEIAFRFNINENVTCAAKFEQPYGAEVAYEDDTLAYAELEFGDVGNGEIGVIGGEGITAPIATEYESESLTVGCGYDFALSTGKLTVIAGPKVQKINGFFSEDLSPDAGDDDLDVSLDGGTEVGYILGAAYSIPEIALRASIIYHSQIDYDADGTVKVGQDVLGFETTGTAKTFTPQTIEIALQSGVAENTLAFFNVRWSEYSKLKDLQVNGDGSATPAALGGATLDEYSASVGGAIDGLINPEVSLFDNDTLDLGIGMGRQLTDKLSLGLGYSTSIKLGSKPAGTPDGADTDDIRLPASDTQTLSFGGEYTVLKGFTVNGGIAYTLLDSYTAEDPEDNGLRLRYKQTEATSFQVGMSYAL